MRATNAVLDPDREANAMADISIGFTVPPSRPFDETLDWAAERGFDHVELLFDSRFARERLESSRDEVAEALSARGLDLVVHLPFAVDIGSPFSPVREGAVAELSAGLDLAAGLGAEKAVFHPQSKAWELGWSGDELREFVLGSTRLLEAAADDAGIELSAENVSGPYDLDHFPDLLARTDVSATFDTGHALLSGHDEDDMADFLREHRGRVSHVHLSDTRGGGDEHLPVGMGRIDFETALAPLLDGWAGTMTHEVGTEELSYIERGKERFDELL
jgi:sugar phosphate isomerase/epimerase